MDADQEAPLVPSSAAAPESAAVADVGIPALQAVLVAQAETGLSYYVPASGAASVGLLKEVMERATNVEKAYQILLLHGELCADKLEDEHALAEYGCARASTRPSQQRHLRILVRFCVPPLLCCPFLPNADMRLLPFVSPPPPSPLPSLPPPPVSPPHPNRDPLTPNRPRPTPPPPLQPPCR